MSKEVISEVVHKEPVDSVPPEVRDKVREQMKISEVVRTYLYAAEKFKTASTDFIDSCNAIRNIVKSNTTIVVSGGYGKYYGKYYLFTSDDDGRFNIEPIEVI